MSTEARTSDHPRSRGVYAGPYQRADGRWGSSPLARGLRRRVSGAGVCGGIIPARAGFTAVQRGSLRRGTDHPRSRGVYSVCPTCGAAARGSSPLARGLRPGSQVDHLPERIIPARAGFTRSPIRSRRLPGDHPRSRGVYAGAPVPWRGADGSSPLARGLHAPLRERPAAQGIIPARAGFTPGGITDE